LPDTSFPPTKLPGISCRRTHYRQKPNSCAQRKNLGRAIVFGKQIRVLAANGCFLSAPELRAAIRARHGDALKLQCDDPASSNAWTASESNTPPKSKRNHCSKLLSVVFTNWIRVSGRKRTCLTEWMSRWRFTRSRRPILLRSRN